MKRKPSDIDAHDFRLFRSSLPDHDVALPQTEVEAETLITKLRHRLAVKKAERLVCWRWFARYYCRFVMKYTEQQVLDTFGPISRAAKNEYVVKEVFLRLRQEAAKASLEAERAEIGQNPTAIVIASQTGTVRMRFFDETNVIKFASAITDCAIQPHVFPWLLENQDEGQKDMFSNIM